MPKHATRFDRGPIASDAASPALACFYAGEKRRCERSAMCGSKKRRPLCREILENLASLKHGTVTEITSGSCDELQSVPAIFEMGHPPSAAGVCSMNTT
jgi:hypothetical protein